MITCDNDTCDLFEGCCFYCPQKSTCECACENDPNGCGYGRQSEPNELKPFETNEQALSLMKRLKENEQKRKELDQYDKMIRAELVNAMDRYGIKSFENELVKLTYTAPTVRETIDSKRLKAELPEIAERFTQRSTVKASVRIVVK